MLDKFIHEKADLISYSQSELSNIANSSNHLREIVKNQRDFNSSFLGGSYRRGTMVKGISDIDVYFEYTGGLDSKTALSRLRSCLVTAYPKTEIKRDTPSIHVDFDRIPFNITPYKSISGTAVISIPDQSGGWQAVRFGELEKAIIDLRAKSSKYIDLIKILKLWNRNHKKNLRNFEIEWQVIRLFQYSSPINKSISDFVWEFFQNSSYQSDANRFFGLMKNNYSEATLKTEWLKFIDNK